MLSRVADNLYWMSRYLERAEHTARVIDLNLNQMLDQSSVSGERRWERLLASLRVADENPPTDDPYAMAHSLTFDSNNRSSIVSCIAAARENARQVREQISSEMWEQLNYLYLWVREANRDSQLANQPHAFLREIKEGSHLFQGITDSTMSHDEGWQFIQVGRSLERAASTAILLDVHFKAYEETPLEYLEWVGLLKSCTAFEAYCRVYTADVQPSQVAEFLLLSEVFPRSVRFSADAAQQSLRLIGRMTGARNASRAERLAGRLCAALDYAQVDEVMGEDIHKYLASIQGQCSQIHTAIQQVYIAYPIETALTA